MQACPRCGLELEGKQLQYDYRLGCTCGGWYCLFPPAYKAPEPLRMVECSKGHLGAWGLRKVGKRSYWKCCFALQHDGKYSICSDQQVEGDLQGFLNGKKSSPAYYTQNWVLYVLYGMGKSGGYISELMPELPSNISQSAAYSSLYKMVRYRHPYVEKSADPEPLARGYAHRFWLSDRGESCAYLLWPELLEQDDSWKH